MKKKFITIFFALSFLASSATADSKKVSLDRFYAYINHKINCLVARYTNHPLYEKIKSSEHVTKEEVESVWDAFEKAPNEQEKRVLINAYIFRLVNSVGVACEVFPEGKLIFTESMKKALDKIKKTYEIGFYLHHPAVVFSGVPSDNSKILNEETIKEIWDQWEALPDSEEKIRWMNMRNWSSHLDKINPSNKEEDFITIPDYEGYEFQLGDWFFLKNKDVFNWEIIDEL